MEYPLVKATSVVSVGVDHLHIGTPPKPAILTVTLDTVEGTDLHVSLTVEAARQLQAMLAKTLQSLGSR